MAEAADTWLCECGALPLLHVLWDADTMRAGLLCADCMSDLTSEGGDRPFAAYHIASGACGPDGECWQRFFDGQAERALRAERWASVA